MVRPSLRLRPWVAGLLMTAVIALVASCAASPAAPSPTPGSSPTVPAAAGPIVLQRMAPNTGCDTIGIDYRKITFHIDPSAEIHVWAETDKGTQLAIRWADGFTADGTPPVIRGPKGEEVARDGTVLEVPEGPYPRLAGYFVCTGVNSIGVYAEEPS